MLQGRGVNISTNETHQLWMPPVRREPAVRRDAARTAHWPQVGSRPAVAVASAEASVLIAAVARAVVEVLTKYRPVQQLTRWLEPSAVDAISMAMRHGDWHDAVVVKAVASSLRDDTIDGVAHVATKHRRLAIAIRLELRRGHWACTDLSVLLPGSHMVSAA